ncbi:hypothetical protein AB7952_07760 [Streptomyces sp. PG2]
MQQVVVADHDALGDEVEPEVYWRNAGPRRPGPGSRHSSAPVVSAPPVTQQAQAAEAERG